MRTCVDSEPVKPVIIVKQTFKLRTGLRSGEHWCIGYRSQNDYLKYKSKNSWEGIKKKFKNCPPSKRLWNTQQLKSKYDPWAAIMFKLFALALMWCKAWQHDNKWDVEKMCKAWHIYKTDYTHHHVYMCQNIWYWHKHILLLKLSPEELLRSPQLCLLRLEAPGKKTAGNQVLSASPRIPEP